MILVSDMCCSESLYGIFCIIDQETAPIRAPYVSKFGATNEANLVSPTCEPEPRMRGQTMVAAGMPGKIRRWPDMITIPTKNFLSIAYRCHANYVLESGCKSLLIPDHRGRMVTSIPQTEHGILFRNHSWTQIICTSPLRQVSWKDPSKSLQK